MLQLEMGEILYIVHCKAVAAISSIQPLPLGSVWHPASSASGILDDGRSSEHTATTMRLSLPTWLCDVICA